VLDCHGSFVRYQLLMIRKNEDNIKFYCILMFYFICNTTLWPTKQKI